MRVEDTFGTLPVKVLGKYYEKSGKLHVNNYLQKRIHVLTPENSEFEAP